MAPTFAKVAIALCIPAVYATSNNYREPELLTDISKISRSWGQISTYADNADNSFGVEDVGLPSGCQVEQAHVLQRHANRFPTGT